MKVNKQNLTPDEELYLKAKEKYAAGMPIMSDVEFDILEDKLHSDDSFIINMVGTKKGPKVDTPHLTPMLSLAKIKFKNNLVPIDEFNYFFKDISKNELIEYGPKLDGNAINCVYQNGKLISIQSRGDGTLGQNYTKQLSNKVPQIIKGFTGEIRGEAVVDMYIFETKYKKDSLVDIDLNKKYCNARNFVAGILNKDFDKSNIDKYNDIDFIAFDIKTDDIIDDTNKWLISKGFDILDKLIIKSLSEN
jgi:NAD-dependent DNA ligase